MATRTPVRPNAKPTSKPTTKGERLEARATQDQKQLIAQAASSMGLTVSEFVLAESLRSARYILEQERVLRLTERETVQVIQMLDEKEIKVPLDVRRAVAKAKALRSIAHA
jgi:uncharacterized protein (DUF1778 family)